MPIDAFSACCFFLSHRFINDKKDRRLATGRWHRIATGEKHIFRVLRFNPSLLGTLNEKEGSIIIDYDGWLQLSGYPEEVPTRLDLVITKAKFYEFPLCAISHPDPAHRLAGWLAIISLLLGLLGIILGLIALLPIF
jgi:hypothetical protein